LGSYFFPGIVLRSAIYGFRLWAGLERHEVQVDNHRWVYLEGGEGEAILFIHGFGADKYSWGLMLPAFKKSYRVIAPDLPGHGENSQIFSASYGVISQVKRLRRFVEVLGLDDFHLMGISLGGYIAALYASEYPQNVKSLALMDSAGVISRIPSRAWLRYKEKGTNLLLYASQEEFDEFMSLLFHNPPELPKPLKAYFIKRVSLKYEFYEKMLNDLSEESMTLLESRLPSIKAKTLIIWGAEDHIIHVSSVEKFEKGLRDSQTKIIENCGHVPHRERPQETIQVYREFLNGLSQ
jgi:abhydrolase domain-containing protein 6